MNEWRKNVAHNSVSANFEAMLLDDGGLGNGPTEMKMIKTFQVLDRIIPQLGIFSEITRMCRNEIFDAVYSKELTGSADCSDDSGKYIQRLPFFLLNQRLEDNYSESETSLKEEIKKLQDNLLLEENSPTESEMRIKLLEEMNQASGESIAQLEKQLEDANSQINSLMESLEELKKMADEKFCHLNREMIELKLELDHANNEVNHLQMYKNNYNKLQNAFQNWSGVEKQPQRQKNKAPASQRTKLSAEVRTCVKLEEQLLKIQNSLIEEFDEFLESVAEVRLQFLPKSEASLVDLSSKEDDKDDDADHRLMTMRDKFTKNIGDIDAELRRLVLHKRQLQEQLLEMEEINATEREQRRSREEFFGELQGGGGEAEALIQDEPSFNPFLPQERLLNKYAIMLYASDNNAKTFFEFKDAAFCSSCHEKTVLCPHRMLDEEHVVTLGVGITHIKLVRPRVRVREAPPDVTKEVSPAADAQDKTPSPVRRSPSAAEIYYFRTVDRLWDDYRQRTDLKRNVPRPLTIDRTVSLINQFIDSLLHIDLNSAEEEECLSILDRLHLFFEDRYVKRSTAFLAVHDFLSSLIAHQISEKFIWLFIQVLIGNLDASVIRYVLLMKDLAGDVTWKNIEDFRTFVKIVYPFLGEDDIEMLFLGYVSFAENKIQESLVINYFVYLIMKYREPRFLEMESVLVSQSVGREDLSYMTEAEFTSSVEQIISVYNRLQRHLFKEAVAYVSQMENFPHGVPLLRLAQISSYVNLVSSTYHMKRQLKSWQIDPAGSAL